MSESTIELYNRKASQYEQHWEKYLNHTHDALLDRIQFESTDSILDISGGTGLLVQKIINRGDTFERFLINDPSEQMMKVAQQRLQDAENIYFKGEKAEQLSCEFNSIDKLICLNAFHFYQNQQQVLDRFHKFLKPGGTIFILDWNRAGFFRVVNKLIQWTQSEYINTRSLVEVQDMLAESEFNIRKTESWNWRYWKLMFIEAQKTEV